MIIRTNLRNAGHYISRREDFDASNLHGRRSDGYFQLSLGRLPLPWIMAYREDRPIYVVYSYSTPIAWVSENGAMVAVPPVVYSRSTSRHQGIARRALLAG